MEKGEGAAMENNREGGHCSTRTVAAAHCSYSAGLGFSPSFIGGRPLMGLLGQGPRPRLPKKSEKPLFLNSILLF